MLGVALDRGLLDGGAGFNLTLTNFTDVISDPLNRKVALTTFEIATAAMLVQLARRGAAGLRDRVQGRSLAGADPALPRPRRRAQPDGPDLRLADAARPRGPDQRGADEHRHHQPADRRAPVQPVRGHARALDELPHLHGDPDLRGDEGDRRQRLRGRPRPRRRLVDDDPQGPAAADRARDLHLAAARLRPAVHRLREPGAGRRHERLHARQRRQRLRARGGRPQPGRGDEHHHARRSRRCSRSSPTGSRGSTGWRADGRRPIRRRHRRRRAQRARRRASTSRRPACGR